MPSTKRHSSDSTADFPPFGFLGERAGHGDLALMRIGLPRADTLLRQPRSAEPVFARAAEVPVTESLRAMASQAILPILSRANWPPQQKRKSLGGSAAAP
jgi:hypothetical protein